ncbi:Maf family protein [Cognatiluteimonas profundi]|uniref:Maf family protein n=1 Tax=Cognatiluteimonas profundi TaxID=2594501 RepID=UPI0018EF1553|nr:Maf family nucleotide pyrophosphatase [Lysobacter profundi]
MDERDARRPPPSGRLLLASTSRYRRELLQRLGLPFEVAAPAVDETPRPGEIPAATATRLAQAKAEALVGTHGDAWVLGSDQVATLDQRTLGKPGGHDRALAQLMAMSGRNVEFLTAVCLARADGQRFHALDVTTVRFRALHEDEVRRYLEAEEPYDCAGSFKAEGLGIALFESIRSEDPTGLIGLPLIATARLLRQAGFAVP